MTTLTGLPDSILWAAVGLGVGVLMLVYVLAGPRPVRLSMQRRQPGAAANPNVLTQVTSSATSVLNRVIRRRSGNAGALALEQAGITMSLPDFALFVVVATLASAAIGAVLAGPLLAILLPPAGWRVPVTFVAVLIALALTGALGARIGGSSIPRATIRVVIGGAVALAATFLIGTLLGTHLG